MQVGSGCAFEMEGGEIYGCYASVSGGAVINEGMFNFTGGKIYSNASGNNGGALVSKGTTLISGGKIYGSASPNGGGIITWSGELTLESGEIYGNTASRNGGGIYHNGGIVKLCGDTRIADNEGGNLYLPTGRTVKAADLSQKASVGVTTAAAPADGASVKVTDGGGSDYREYFHSDGDLYEVINGEGNAVCLRLFPFETEVNSDGSDTLIIRGYTGGDEKVVIPERIGGKTVTEVYDLGGRSDVASVTIPKTVSQICGGAFYSLPNLKEVRFDGLNDDAVTVGAKAFPDSLEKIYFPSGLTDSDIKAKMGLDIFPEGAALYSGDVVLPHDFSDYDSDESRHWQVCAACGEIKPDSAKEHSGAGEYEKVSDTHHRRLCECGLQIDTLHEWNEEVITVPATEAEDGEAKYTCTLCGAETLKAVPALGHTHKWGEWSITSAPSETLGGTAERICEGNSEHKEELSLPNLKDGAVWTAGARVEPTKDRDGSQEYTSVYGKVTVILPKTGGGADTPEEPTSPEEPTDPEEPTSPEEPTTPVDPDDGSLAEDTQIGADAPRAEFSMTLEKLAGAVLTEQELAKIKDGVDIKIILTVEDARNTASAEDKTAVEDALRGLDGYKLGQYLDIGLIKEIGEARERVVKTSKPIAVTLELPEELLGKNRSCAIIRIHDGRADILEDRDDNPNTVTVETDLFSTYAIVFYEERTPVATGVKSAAALCVALGVCALLMLALLCFTTGRNGMSEEKKERIFSGLVAWGKKGGRLRTRIALALIFLLLSFYYCIGKRTLPEKQLDSSFK
ncbi:MAG: leucine-rich repeat domain-containing protein [Butyrivibrio sp.]|nr:leucine-rich repeat domain-containing protein [Butyrivibrio sp.]